MDIQTIEFDNTLVLIYNNQKICITPFTCQESSMIKLGIDAPHGISVNREEIYEIKKAREQLAQARNTPEEHAKLVQNVFYELSSVSYKSEKLEKAAKELYGRDKIITAKTIACIASGTKSTTSWILTCAIDVLINEKSESLKRILTSDDMRRLWLKPLIKQGIDKSILLKKEQNLNNPSLLEQINQLN